MDTRLSRRGGIKTSLVRVIRRCRWPARLLRVVLSLTLAFLLVLFLAVAAVAASVPVSVAGEGEAAPSLGSTTDPAFGGSETSTPTTMSHMSTVPEESSTTVGPVTTEPASTAVAGPGEESVPKPSGVVDAGGGAMAGTGSGLWGLIALAVTLTVGLVFSSVRARPRKGAAAFERE